MKKNQFIPTITCNEKKTILDALKEHEIVLLDCVEEDVLENFAAN